MGKDTISLAEQRRMVRSSFGTMMRLLGSDDPTGDIPVGMKSLVERIRQQIVQDDYELGESCEEVMRALVYLADRLSPPPSPGA